MSSIAQTSSDTILSMDIGTLVIYGLVEITTFSVFYGIFSLLFVQSTMIFVRKHLSSRAHWWMFFTSAFSLLLATVHGAALFTFSYILAHSTLVGNQNMSLGERVDLAILLQKTPTLLIVWSSAFGPTVSDSVVIWRAYVLLKSQRKRWLIILPLLLLLGSTAMNLANAILAAMGDNIYAGLSVTTFLMGIRLSLAANTVATAIFGYVYWLHKEATAGLNAHRPTQMVRVLAVFMESGIAFCIPQAIYVILTSVPQESINTPGQSIQDVFIMAYFAFSYMYPTVVIVLVNRHQTLNQYLSEAFSLSNSGMNRPGGLPQMSFGLPELAARTKESSRDDGTDNDLV